MDLVWNLENPSIINSISDVFRKIQPCNIAIAVLARPSSVTLWLDFGKWIGDRSPLSPLVFPLQRLPPIISSKSSPITIM
jgi:hypothetical protein